jgi:hypothetical protein
MLVRELRRLDLRPVCRVCEHRRGEQVTVEIEHPPGEEIQWDWLELSPEVSINGDSYRMRAHRAGVNALRPAITGGEFS